MATESTSPTKVKVFGIINLVYAGISLLFIVGGLIMQRMGSVSAGGNEAGREMQAIQQQLMNLPQMKIFTYVSMVIAVILLALLIAGGIFLLKRDIRGRTFSLIYAGAGIGFSIISTAYQYLVIQDFYREIVLSSNLEEAVQSSVLTVSKFSPIFGLFCGLLYPIILLIVMAPQKFADALQPPVHVDLPSDTPDL